MKAHLYGYSDDCANVEVDGKRVNDGEYTDKRLVLTLPDGSEIVATLEYGAGWGVRFEVPDTVEIEAQERDGYGEDNRPWTPIK